MAPQRYQPAKAGSTATSSTASDKEELLKARALARAHKRAERVKARCVEAENHKEVGNVHFRKGEYRKALTEYEVAIKINGPSPVYLSNMAAAWLKLEAYDIAEHCAQRALVLDPLFVKARYRRGLARKGNLQFYAASLDFAAVLNQDPGSTEADKELEEMLTFLRERDDSDEDDESTIEFNPLFPSVYEKQVELESVSDSSDWKHKGNSIPCRFYNHDGCMRGTECKFSHAPDHKSVRDRLGRNICMYFLLENCKFGSSGCVYSHDRTYLPSGRWWDDKGKVALLGQISTGRRPKENPAFMPYMCGLADNRLAWASAHGVEMEDVYGHWRDKAMVGFHDAADEGCHAAYKSSGRGNKGMGGRGRGRGRGGGGIHRGHWHGELDLDPDALEESESESEERMNNFGFTEDEVEELLCQGVKPWDDDACDVLEALYSL